MNLQGFFIFSSPEPFETYKRNTDYIVEDTSKKLIENNEVINITLIRTNLAT